MKKNLFVLFASLVLAMALGTSINAQNYLKGPGINGPAEVNGTKGWIDVLSVKSLNYEEVKVTYLDASSPYLKDASNGNYEIIMFKKGGDGYLIITMENVEIEQTANVKSSKSGKVYGMILKSRTIKAVSYKPGGESRTLTNKELNKILK